MKSRLTVGGLLALGFLAGGLATRVFAADTPLVNLPMAGPDRFYRVVTPAQP